MKVGSMHSIVRKLLREAVRVSKGDEKLLETGTRSTLAELYRTQWGQGTSQSLVQASDTCLNVGIQPATQPNSTGLDTLIAAAFQQERCDERRNEQEPHGSELELHRNLAMSGAQDGGSTRSEGQVSALYGTTTNPTGMNPGLQVRPNFGPRWDPKMNSWEPDQTTPSTMCFNAASAFPVGMNEAGISIASPAGLLSSNTGEFMTDDDLHTWNFDFPIPSFWS